MNVEKKPVIGVVGDVYRGGRHALHTVQEKYLDAVTAGANAIALILPAMIDRPEGTWPEPGDIDLVLDMVDAVFLTGATSNVAPSRYGAALADPASPADTARDHVSLAVIERAVGRGMPVMGVCRGFQEINVALGGTLHQAVHEVPGLVDHREDGALPLERQYGPVHAVQFVPNGLLQMITGLTRTRVNSLHGQGVATLAPGLVVEAVAPDGLIEAYRGAGESFLLGVQWHPEWAFREDAVSVAMFRAFGAATRAYQGVRQRARDAVLAV